MADGIRSACPDAVVQFLPMADGGEGTLEAVLTACPGELCSCVVEGADGRPLRVDYAVAKIGRASTAVIEVARVVGKGLMGSQPTGVEERSTIGVGQLLNHALGNGLRRFLIGLGGSYTNDGGAGLLAALGVVLRDQDGRKLAPTLRGLAQLSSLDFSALDGRLAQCDILLLADVRNPLCGLNGATAVYGPQKGVTTEQVPLFDACLQGYATLGDAWAGKPISRMPGAGAAGGLGYALQLLGAEYRSGADYLCQLLKVERMLRQADLLITGEGCSDAQTLQGKAPAVLAEYARAAGVPAVLVAGCIDAPARPALAQIFRYCLALDAACGMQRAMHEPQRCLEQVCHDLLRDGITC
jgi:glycerate kinase